jgi:uncharacterized coiled-coil protein SlyX
MEPEQPPSLAQKVQEQEATINQMSFYQLRMEAKMERMTKQMEMMAKQMEVLQNRH